jgi:hypothetical protein
MKSIKTNRGFIIVEHPRYLNGKENARLIQESSAIGDYDDSFKEPGSSYLWVGEHHHLNREEVGELIKRMQRWLQVGRLAEDEKE